MQHLDKLKNLVVMAIADGSLGEHELALLSDRCGQLGMTEDELREAVSYALSEDASIRLPKDPTEQDELLSDLLRMMAADGQLSEAEKRLFATAAALMGFGRDKIDQLIDRLGHVQE